MSFLGRHTWVHGVDISALQVTAWSGGLCDFLSSEVTVSPGGSEGSGEAVCDGTCLFSFRWL